MTFPFVVRDVVSWGRYPWRDTDEQRHDAEAIDQSMLETVKKDITLASLDAKMHT